MITSPNNPSALGPAAISGLSVLDADVDDDECDEGQEVEESNDCRIDVGDVDDDECDGSDVVGEDYGEVHVPSLLVPFLTQQRFTLLSVSASSPSLAPSGFLSPAAISSS